MDELTDKPSGTEPKLKEARPRLRRKQGFTTLDNDAVVRYVLERLRLDLDEREEWNQMRLDRYAKLRGWLPDKKHPLGTQAANVWMPVMLTASLRLKAGLENATKSMRPLMQSKAHQRRNIERQENIDRLLDYQIFAEGNGEVILDEYISNLVDDGTAIAFQRWVRRDSVVHDVRLFPAPDAEIDLNLQIFTAIKTMFPNLVDAFQKGSDEYHTWDVYYQDDDQRLQNAVVDFYDTDNGQIEAHITTRVRAYDGPAIEVQDLEDIVVPIRAANLQPVSPENPHGSAYVNRICETTLDQIRRLKKDGTYDLLDDAGLALIEQREGPWQGELNERMKELKDIQEGRDATHLTDLGKRIIIEHYGKWDVDGDGLEEDVIFWVARDAKVLLRARYLTEIYPGIPIRRPFAETKLFPIPNRFYGMSLSEILEPIQDMIKAIMDQNFDWGLITNIPFFFYRPSSGLKQEDMKLSPGTGYPLDRPMEDVNFPTWNRDMSWTINTLTILQQYAERISMQSDVQFGRVPTGKASALRTLGTTAALLQQGDVRSEQILRRLFLGLAQVYQSIHRLNRRYLPPKKELRVIGQSDPGHEPYLTITPDHIDADVDFEFQATLLNTNKQVVAQSLAEIMGLLVSPVAIQLGLVDAGRIYTLFRDSIKSRDMDPDKYLSRPPASVLGPRYSAEDILSMILAGETPSAMAGPLEPIQEHIQKLVAFVQGNDIGYFNENQTMVLKAWMDRMLLLLQQQMQEQAMLQAAAQFQQEQKQGSEGPGGAPTTFDAQGAQENPLVGPGESITPNAEGQG